MSLISLRQCHVETRKTRKTPITNNTLTTLDRDPVTVNPGVVRRTNNVYVERPERLPDIPIAVIASGVYLYIVDGNHRFAADVKMGRTVKAWILTAKDRKKLRGTPPNTLRAWADGQRTFAELKQSAVHAYKEYVRV